VQTGEESEGKTENTKDTRIRPTNGSSRFILHLVQSSPVDRKATYQTFMSEFTAR
jgi:hypothetical protein